jgi:hypothetical protein
MSFDKIIDLKMRKSIIIILMLILSSCKFNLTSNDLKTFNIYKENDTLIFENSLGDLDTFMVSSKSIINKGWDENTGWYNPPLAKVHFKDIPHNKYGTTVIRWEHSDTITEDQVLLTVYKRKPSIGIEETISIKNFIGIIDRQNQKTNSLDLQNSDIIYKVDPIDKSSIHDSSDIINVYWSDKLGIVAYDSKNGERWKLNKK